MAFSDRNETLLSTRYLVILINLFVLSGCAGSPAATSGMTPQQLADSYYRDYSLEELCAGGRNLNPLRINVCRPRVEPGRESFCQLHRDARMLEVIRRGRPRNYCQNPEEAERKIAFEAQWDTEVYNIDLLKVTTQTKKNTSFCKSGSEHRILVEGQISPDSSFAMARLLLRLQPCKNASGREIIPVTVFLKSDGGFLNDGYLMGETFRERGVTTIVEDGEICASSCAVAFLGGAKRLVEDGAAIMYHAPYFNGKNSYGKRDINCDVGDKALAELNSFYRKMTDEETGDRLFERTMWYCSAEDGWVVKGGSAAELFGIATDK